MRLVLASAGAFGNAQRHNRRAIRAAFTAGFLGRGFYFFHPFPSVSIMSKAERHGTAQYDPAKGGGSACLPHDIGWCRSFNSDRVPPIPIADLLPYVDLNSEVPLVRPLTIFDFNAAMMSAWRQTPLELQLRSRTAESDRALNLHSVFSYALFARRLPFGKAILSASRRGAARKPSQLAVFERPSAARPTHFAVRQMPARVLCVICTRRADPR